jgi:integrase
MTSFARCGSFSSASRHPTEKQAPGRKLAKHDADGNPFCPISAAMAGLQKVRLLTAQRGGEVVAMRWQDLDLRTPAWWTILGELAKNYSRIA